MKKKPLSKTAASKSPTKKPKASASKASATTSGKQKSKVAASGKPKKIEKSAKKSSAVAKPILKSAVKAIGQAGKKLVASMTKGASAGKKSDKTKEKFDAKKQEISKKSSDKIAENKDLKKTKSNTDVPSILKDSKKNSDIDAKVSAKAAPSKTSSKTGAAPAAIVPAKKVPGKKGKTAKKETTDDADDDFVDTDDLLGGDSEIAEYEEELQAVEEMDEEDYDDEAELLASDNTDSDDEIILTDAEGRRYCRVKDCDQLAAVDGYCRYHYLLLWRRIQIRKKILADGKLEKYIEELTGRYPDKFLEMIRKDLKTEKDFLSAISELEIDESSGENEFEEETQTYIDEVRGLETTTGVDDDEY